MTTESPALTAQEQFMREVGRLADAYAEAADRIGTVTGLQPYDADGESEARAALMDYVLKMLRYFSDEWPGGIEEIEAALRARPAGELTDEREAFEKAWLDYLPKAKPIDQQPASPAWIERADLNKQDDRLSYCEHRTRDAYFGWKARAALSAPVAPAGKTQEAARYRWILAYYLGNRTFPAYPVIGVCDTADEVGARIDRYISGAPAWNGQYGGWSCVTQTNPANSGVPPDAACFYKDGTSWCCVRGDFVNLQESPAGFGDTMEVALNDLHSQCAKDQSSASLCHPRQTDKPVAPAGQSERISTLEALICDIAPMLDVIKSEWSREGCWSEWDQSLRDRITQYNLVKMGAASPTPAAPQPDTVDVAIALEQQRALKIVDDVRSLPIGGRTETMPTAFHSGYCTACDEIEHRLRTEQWELCGHPMPLPEPIPQEVQPPMSDERILGITRKTMPAYFYRVPDREWCIFARALLAEAQQPDTEDSAPSARELLERARDVMDNLLAVIDAAGLLNLSNGVELGATVWYVKASDAADSTRDTIAAIRAHLGEIK